MCSHKFDIARMCWPYSEGYGVFCRKCRMILDTGLSSFQLASEIAAQENRKIAAQRLTHKGMSFLQSLWNRFIGKNGSHL